MIGLPLQQLLSTDQLVFLAKPDLAFHQGGAQTLCHGFVLDQLALAGLERAGRRPPGNDNWDVRQMSAALVVGLNLRRFCCSIAHVSGCARDARISLIQIKPASDTGHYLTRWIAAAFPVGDKEAGGKPASSDPVQ